MAEFVTFSEDAQRIMKLAIQFAEAEDRVWNSLQHSYSFTRESVPPTLFHYTSAGGFQGIITDGEIRATECRALNDPDEGKYATELLDDIVAKQLPDSLRAEIEKRRRERAPGPWLATRLFVASFSVQGNDLSQWRSYADDGRGFSLAIRTAGLNPPHAEWVRVLYEPTDQAELVRLLVVKLTEECRSFAATNRVSDEWMNIIAANAVIRMVERLKPFFKHSSYRSEEEWRLVRSVPTPTKRPDSIQIRVRTQGHRLVTYSPVSLTGSDGLIPLGVCYFGPAQEPNWESAFDLMREAGYVDRGGFSVSGIPYRSNG